MTTVTIRRPYTVVLALPGLLLFNLGSAQQCPDDMVWVEATNTCLDRYEWPNKKGVRPTLALSAIPNQVDGNKDLNIEALCASVGKRACEFDEWVAACKGEHGSDYPFGSDLPRLTDRDAAPCNYAKLYIKPDEYKVFWRDAEELARLDQSDPAGDRGCRSASGAEDMMGNGEEWIRCPSWLSSNGWCLAGRYWSSPEPCGKMALGHDPGWHFYETSGRCCKDL